MYSKNVTIENPTGLHARPASIFIKTATQFKSKINIIKDEREVSAKSMLSLLSLGLTKGTEIIISADGEDEKEAIDTLVELVNSRFGE
jgi:phosphocarrier protein HPr